MWVALFDDAHQLSEQAIASIDTPGLQITTCPLVENRVVRVMSLPGYGKHCGLPIHAVRVREACSALNHTFWADDISLRDDTRMDFSRVQGHNQITDLYLLAPAVHHSGCLATFDPAISLTSLPGATAQHLRVL